MEPQTTNPDAAVDPFPQAVDLDVLQQDIDEGVRRNGHECPIARACRRIPAFQHARVYVGFDRAQITPDDQAGQGPQKVVYDLGRTGEQFVSSFDWNKAVVPVTVHLARAVARTEIDPDAPAVPEYQDAADVADE